MPQSFNRLTSEQIVAEIRRAKSEIESSARHLMSAATELHARTRRPDFRELASQVDIPEGMDRVAADRMRQDAVGEAISVYTLYANSWLRFAGSVIQAIRRSGNAEKLLLRLEGKRGISTQVLPRQHPSKRLVSPETPGDDIAQLYGVEMVTHAQR